MEDKDEIYQEKIIGYVKKFSNEEDFKINLAKLK